MADNAVTDHRLSHHQSLVTDGSFMAIGQGSIAIRHRSVIWRCQSVCCLVDNTYRVTSASTAMPTQHTQFQHNSTQYQHIHRQPTVGRASPHKAATGCCSTTMLQAAHANFRNRLTYSSSCLLEYGKLLEIGDGYIVSLHDVDLFSKASPTCLQCPNFFRSQLDCTPRSVSTCLDCWA
jgi:hypothetical protein